MTVHRLITAAECHKRTNEIPSVPQFAIKETMCFTINFILLFFFRIVEC